LLSLVEQKQHTQKGAYGGSSKQIADMSSIENIEGHPRNEKLADQQPVGQSGPEKKEPHSLLAIVILTAATLACLLPFLGKAFHIDDPLFIWTARHVVSEPFNFYNFNVNWSGREEAMSTAMQNPPLAAYYLALVGVLLGWSEIALHAGFLLPALALVLGTHRLARRFCAHPLAAALATLATPVFLVSSTSVMCDTMMVAFWVWALIFWTEGMAENKPVKLWISALLIAASGLTKYFGFALVPLVAAFSVAERRKLSSWVACILFPLIVLALYEWWTRKLYGRDSLLDGLQFAQQAQSGRGAGSPLYTKVLVELSFIGGSMILLLFSAPFLWSRRLLAGGTAALLLLGAALVVHKKLAAFDLVQDGHTKWLFVVEFTLFVTTGGGIMLLAISDLWRNRTAESLLLFLWIAGTFVFVLNACWQISGRYLYPMLPAVSILLIRRMEWRNWLHDRNRLGLFGVPLAMSLAIALTVTWGDFKLANSARKASAYIQKETAASPSSSVWFEGHWGFQYYMQNQGAKAFDFRHQPHGSNDVLVLPMKNCNVFYPPPAQFVPWFQFDCEPSKCLITMNDDAGAGFYSDFMGPMPFGICRVYVGKYFVFRAKP
jgi:4-amino-4-deoxy-L-arabinose transferase-like glycosyltransferase